MCAKLENHLFIRLFELDKTLFRACPMPALAYRLKHDCKLKASNERPVAARDRIELPTRGFSVFNFLAFKFD
jgi:hypothetical protein